MRINPIGIQTYQQATQREKEILPSGDSQARERADVAAITGDPVTIRPSQDDGSPLVVKPVRGNYADLLSPQEKQALDLLFARYRDSERFGGTYNGDKSTEEETRNLGRLVDVKV